MGKHSQRGRAASSRRVWQILGAALAAPVLLLTACTPNSSPGSSTDSAEPTTFTFGTSADPVGLDPALETDVDSARVTRQIFEGLVTADPTTGQPAPALATSWSSSNKGASYEFKLRGGVKFQDGTDFNAAAVCTNFDRWAKFSDKGLNSNATAFKQVFATPVTSSGNPLPTASPSPSPTDSASPEPTENPDGGTSVQAPVITTSSVYSSCIPETHSSVRINLNAPLTNFVLALTEPGFAIASPTSLSKGGADTQDHQLPGAPADSPDKVSQFALAPSGTGPYKLESWQKGAVTLSANPDYWGKKGQVTTVKLLTYDTPATRVLALKQGKIDGFDFVSASDLDSLVTGGYQVLQRDPFSVLYMGMNEKLPGLANPKARQAAAMAIDKEALTKNYFIDGSAKAYQFVPPKLSGFNNLIKTPTYDVEKAKQLLKESGYNGQPLPFYYPTNVTRPYLPSPEKLYADISANLTAVGFNIKPVPIPWSDGYAQKVESANDAAFYLLGNNGDYSDADNFLGPLFGTPNPSMGFDDPVIMGQIAKARSMPDGAERTDEYQQINQNLSTLMPAVPLVFPISALTLSPKVSNYPVSPVLSEVYNQIKISK